MDRNLIGQRTKVRQILFKAKRKDNGEWVEGYYRADPDLDEYFICGWKYGYSENGIEREPFDEEVNSSTICQYIGLTDKNYKKIWENDIVVEEHKCTIITKYRVVFDLEEGAWMLETKSGARYGIGTINQNNFEVIGNVFDNAERWW